VRALSKASRRRVASRAYRGSNLRTTRVCTSGARAKIPQECSDRSMCAQTKKFNRHSSSKHTHRASYSFNALSTSCRTNGGDTCALACVTEIAAPVSATTRRANGAQHTSDVTGSISYDQCALAHVKLNVKRDELRASSDVVSPRPCAIITGCRSSTQDHGDIKPSISRRLNNACRLLKQNARQRRECVDLQQRSAKITR
jgi:hypothetical protein